MSGSWGRHDEPEAAVERILDAAEELHVRQGVDATTMLDVAAAAGCSRATLYLYFPGKQELRTALRNRAAARIAGETLEAVGGIGDPVDRATEAVLATLTRVRSTPALMVWFEPDQLSRTVELSHSPDAVAVLAGALDEIIGPGGGAEPADAELRARFAVRIILSLLTTPGPTPAEERALVGRVIAPALVAPVVR